MNSRTTITISAETNQELSWRDAKDLLRRVQVHEFGDGHDTATRRVG
jgi:hypothetical protein